MHQVASMSFYYKESWAMNLLNDRWSRKPGRQLEKIKKPGDPQYETGHILTLFLQ